MDNRIRRKTSVNSIMVTIASVCLVALTVINF